MARTQPADRPRPIDPSLFFSPAEGLRRRRECELRSLLALLHDFIVRIERTPVEADRRPLTIRLQALFRASWATCPPPSPAGLLPADFPHAVRIRECWQGMVNRLMDLFCSAGDVAAAHHCYEAAISLSIFCSGTVLFNFGLALADAGQIPLLCLLLVDAMRRHPASFQLGQLIPHVLRRALRRLGDSAAPSTLPYVYGLLRAWAQRFHAGTVPEAASADLLAAIAHGREHDVARTLRSDLQRGTIVASLDAEQRRMLSLLASAHARLPIASFPHALVAGGGTAAGIERF